MCGPEIASELQAGVGGALYQAGIFRLINLIIRSEEYLCGSQDTLKHSMADMMFTEKILKHLADLLQKTPKSAYNAHHRSGKQSPSQGQSLLCFSDSAGFANAVYSENARSSFC